MAATKNGFSKMAMWIASGLAAALLSVALLWMASIAQGIDECKDGIALHGERIRAVEIVGEGMQEDIGEIKSDVKSINSKLDRALRQGH